MLLILLFILYLFDFIGILSQQHQQSRFGCQCEPHALTLIHNYQGLPQWRIDQQLLPLSSRGRLGWGFALCFYRQNRI